MMSKRAELEANKKRKQEKKERKKRAMSKRALN